MASPRGTDREPEENENAAVGTGSANVPEADEEACVRVGNGSTKEPVLMTGFFYSGNLKTSDRMLDYYRLPTELV